MRRLGKEGGGVKNKKIKKMGEIKKMKKEREIQNLNKKQEESKENCKTKTDAKQISNKK